MFILAEKRKAKRPRRCVENISEGAPSIDVLTDDCLLQIFSYLPLPDRSRIERVSKRWQSLNSRAWNNFRQLHLGLHMIITGRSINRYEQYINDRSVEKILSQCGRFLTHLTIHAFQLACQYILPSIVKHCKNLTYLDLSLDTYPVEELASIFANCEQLEYLKLGELEQTFNGECLTNLSSNRIQEMYLITTGKAVLHRIGAECIKNMVKLHKLELQGFKLGEDVVELIADNQTISDLTFVHCQLSGTDHFIKMRGLKDLNLYNTRMRISQQSRYSLKKNFPTMRCLSLYRYCR